MAKRIEKLKHIVNAIEIEQRSTDGFINGTAMCVAHGKDLSNWLRTDDTLELAMVVAQDLGIEPNPVKKRDSVFTRVSALYPTLVIVKRGSPETGGGTWLHPDLAIQLAQWCSKQFGLQVSRWVKEWMTSGVNPSVLEADKDRIAIRDEVKDKRRLALTSQVKSFLIKSGKYNLNSKETGYFFGAVHDEVNLVVTGERAKDMRQRLENYLGHPISDQELLRDYFPIVDLVNYASVCQAAANNMNEGVDPINAVRLAAKQVLPLKYNPMPIDFTEKIALVRSRVYLALSR